MADRVEIPDQGIRASLRHVQEKLEFLGTLYENGRKQEALILCCIYIEGFAQRIYGESSRSRSMELFVKVLLDFGSEETLCLVDPRALLDELDRAGKPVSELAKVVDHLCSKSPIEFHTTEGIGNLVPDGDHSNVERFRQLCLESTVAAMVYRELRSPLAHDNPFWSQGLTFSAAVFQGKPVERVSFDTLYAALCRVATRWKELFIANPPRTELGSA